MLALARFNYNKLSIGTLVVFNQLSKPDAHETDGNPRSDAN